MQDNFLMGTKHMEERAERLAELEQFRMVENDFVMVDPNAEDRAAENVRQRLNRQIEEGVYNIKPQDYNEEGELKSEFVGGAGTNNSNDGSRVAPTPEVVPALVMGANATGPSGKPGSSVRQIVYDKY